HRRSHPGRRGHPRGVVQDHGVAEVAGTVLHRRGAGCQRASGRLQLPVGLGLGPRRRAVRLMAGTLLVIGYVWPEPRSSAAGGHMMQLLECFLADGWRITFASPARSGEHRADLSGLGIEEVEIELNSSSFDDFALALQPDVVLFDRFMMEEQFGWRVAQACPDALR